MPPKGRNLPKLLQAAEDQLLARGYAGTTVDAVCEAAGVTKGTFYHHFPSKEALAEALIDRYYQAIEAEFLAVDLAALDDPVERLDAFLAHAVDVARGPALRRGCLLGMLAVDVGEDQTHLRRLVAARFERLTDLLTGLVRAALKGRTRLRLDAKILARQFLAVLEGAIVLGKAHDEPALLVEALACYRQTLIPLLAG